jgi:hypothetical protein
MSHSVPLLGGKGQDPLAKSKFTKVEVNVAQPRAVVELTEAYKEFAKSVQRGIVLVEGRRAVLVQDEFDLATPCDVTWAMTTDAQIDVRGSLATLSLNGKTLTARLLRPAGARFTVESAPQEPPQAKNPGVSRLLVKLPQASGQVCVAVLLSPAWPDGKTAEAVELKPLTKW